VSELDERGASERDAPREVDSWRFTGPFLAELLSRLIAAQPAASHVPWTPVRKPLAASRVALLSSAGLSMKGDAPFDMELERRNPMRGDPSWRRLRADATGDTVEANHLHVDTSYLKRDLDVALPLGRLRELVAAGEVGAIADSHYAIMGYQGGDASTLERESAPAIADAMRREEVDLALLVPV